MTTTTGDPSVDDGDPAVSSGDPADVVTETSDSTATDSTVAGSVEPIEAEAPGWLAAVGRSLDRPLTSYHLVLGVSGMLLALGLMMVASASSVYALQNFGDPYAIFQKQAIWVLIGLPMAWAATRLPTKVLRALAYPMLFGSAVLLALTYTPLGVLVNGNRNWLDFGGPFMVQPSELAKLALVVWGADLLARKEKLLDQGKHLVIPFVPVCGAVLALVLGQGDLGTALVLFAMVLVLLFVVGMPMRFFGIFVLAVGSIVTFLAITEGYRLERLTSFLDPFADYRDTGWQAAHSLFALGTGNWWGVGIGASREKWGSLPEAHTDFIYAVIGEELGLAGTLVVLGLFAVLAFVGVRIALRAPDLFTRLGAAAIVGWITAQALVNMGAVLSLLPITGIPLPLVSYGGSAMLPTLFAIGILVSFAKNEPAAQEALAVKAERRRAARQARRAAEDAEEEP